LKIRIVEFDGTPEELARAKPDLIDLASTSATSGQKGPAIEMAAPKGPSVVDTQLIARVFNRRPLSDSVKKVFEVLLRADPEGLSTTEIAKAVGISRQELAGVFGAFGRRTASTPGWPKDESFVGFTRKYNDHEGREEWRYWLPPAVRQVLESGAVRL